MAQCGPELNIEQVQALLRDNMDEINSNLDSEEGKKIVKRVVEYRVRSLRSGKEFGGGKKKKGGMGNGDDEPPAKRTVSEATTASSYPTLDTLATVLASATIAASVALGGYCVYFNYAFIEAWVLSLNLVPLYKECSTWDRYLYTSILETATGRLSQGVSYFASLPGVNSIASFLPSSVGVGPVMSCASIDAANSNIHYYSVMAIKAALISLSALTSYGSSFTFSSLKRIFSTILTSIPEQVKAYKMKKSQVSEEISKALELSNQLGRIRAAAYKKTTLTPTPSFNFMDPTEADYEEANERNQASYAKERDRLEKEERVKRQVEIIEGYANAIDELRISNIAEMAVAEAVARANELPVASEEIKPIVDKVQSRNEEIDGLNRRVMDAIGQLRQIVPDSSSAPSSLGSAPSSLGPAPSSLGGRRRRKNKSLKRKTKKKSNKRRKSMKHKSIKHKSMKYKTRRV